MGSGISSTLNKCVAYAQIATSVLLLGTVIFAGLAYINARSDYEARNRPYLAIEEIAFYEDTGKSVILVVGIMNYGQQPATNINLGQLSVQTVSDTPWRDIAFVMIKNTENTLILPTRPNRTLVEIDKSDYENVILKSNILKFRFEYMLGSKEYWYEADARLQNNGDWIIESEWCN